MLGSPSQADESSARDAIRHGTGRAGRQPCGSAVKKSSCPPKHGVVSRRESRGPGKASTGGGTGVSGRLRVRPRQDGVPSQHRLAHAAWSESGPGLSFSSRMGLPGGWRGTGPRCPRDCGHMRGPAEGCLRSGHAIRQRRECEARKRINKYRGACLCSADPPI